MRAPVILAAFAGVLPSIVVAQKAYQAYTWNPSSAVIHDLPIIADSGKIRVGVPTTAACPAGSPPGCVYNTTIITGPTYGNRWWMGVLQDGGQAIYADPTTDYTLHYGAAPGTGAATEPIPDDFQRQFFVVTNATTTNGQPKLMSANVPRNWGLREDDPMGPVDFSACQGGQYDFTVHAGLQLRCYDFQIVLKETTAPAPQYYDCPASTCKYY